MDKSLSQRLADSASQKKSLNHAKNRASFLAIKDDIKKAIDDGWPVKNIWEILKEEGKILFSCQTFRSYVKKLILSKKATPLPHQDQKPHAPEIKQAAAIEKKSAEMPGFTYHSTPKQEDLL